MPLTEEEKIENLNLEYRINLLIDRALAKHPNRKDAAKELGVSPVKLRNILNKRGSDYKTVIKRKRRLSYE